MPAEPPFDWNDANIDKVEYHGVRPAGRVLFVVFTMRDRAIRIITAYDASETEKRQYRRWSRR